jgi:hypothetical protein
MITSLGCLTRYFNYIASNGMERLYRVLRGLGKGGRVQFQPPPPPSKHSSELTNFVKERP